MPVMNGLEAAPLLIRILPQVRLILFTAHNGPEVDRLSDTAGIHAVVPKSNACGPPDRTGRIAGSIILHCNYEGLNAARRPLVVSVPDGHSDKRRSFEF